MMVPSAPVRIRTLGANEAGPDLAPGSRRQLAITLERMKSLMTVSSVPVRIKTLGANEAGPDLALGSRLQLAITVESAVLWTSQYGNP